MNPLDRILSWLENQNEDLQYDLIALSAHFHLDNTIELAFDKEEKIKLYKEYINSEGLSKSEILKRALYIIKLIDFSVDKRDSESGWTETMDNHLMLMGKIKEDGLELDNTPSKEFFETFHERKEMWINACSLWYELTNTELSNRAIADWYFFGNEAE